MMDDLYIEGNCTEGHLYERALWAIFSCSFLPNEKIRKFYE